MFAKPRVAAQMYVWSQHYAKQGTTLDEHMGEALKLTKQAGFTAVQGWLSWFEDEKRAAQVGSLLAHHRLTMPAAYAGGTLHEAAKVEATIAQIVAQARRAKKAARLQLVVLNPDVRDDKKEKTDDELTLQAQALDQLARALARVGVQLAVHAHDKEMRSGAREWRHILENTTAAVGICLDLHWALRGKQDPLALLDEAGDRLRDLHLRNSKDDVWTESLGAGDLDMRLIAKALWARRYAGFLTVELAYEEKTELARSLPDNLRASRQFVKMTFGM